MSSQRQLPGLVITRRVSTLASTSTMPVRIATLAPASQWYRVSH
jgi:hypothetical protein